MDLTPAGPPINVPGDRARPTIQLTVYHHRTATPAESFKWLRTFFASKSFGDLPFAATVRHGQSFATRGNQVGRLVVTFDDNRADAVAGYSTSCALQHNGDGTQAMKARPELQQLSREVQRVIPGATQMSIRLEARHHAFDDAHCDMTLNANHSVQENFRTGRVSELALPSLSNSAGLCALSVGWFRWLLILSSDKVRHKDSAPTEEDVKYHGSYAIVKRVLLFPHGAWSVSTVSPAGVTLTVRHAVIDAEPAEVFKHLRCLEAGAAKAAGAATLLDLEDLKASSPARMVCVCREPARRPNEARPGLTGTALAIAAREVPRLSVQGLCNNTHIFEPSVGYSRALAGACEKDQLRYNSGGCNRAEFMSFIVMHDKDEAGPQRLDQLLPALLQDSWQAGVDSREGACLLRSSTNCLVYRVAVNGLEEGRVKATPQAIARRKAAIASAGTPGHLVHVALPAAAYWPTPAGINSGTIQAGDMESERLKANPGNAAQFDETRGAGAAVERICDAGTGQLSGEVYFVQDMQMSMPDDHSDPDLFCLSTRSPTMPIGNGRPQRLQAVFLEARPAAAAAEVSKYGKLLILAPTVPLAHSDADATRGEVKLRVLCQSAAASQALIAIVGNSGEALAIPVYVLGCLPVENAGQGSMVSNCNTQVAIRCQCPCSCSVESSAPVAPPYPVKMILKFDSVSSRALKSAAKQESIAYGRSTENSRKDHIANARSAALVTHWRPETLMSCRALQQHLIAQQLQGELLAVTDPMWTAGNSLKQILTTSLQKTLEELGQNSQVSRGVAVSASSGSASTAVAGRREAKRSSNSSSGARTKPGTEFEAATQRLWMFVVPVDHLTPCITVPRVEAGRPKLTLALCKPHIRNHAKVISAQQSSTHKLTLSLYSGR
jgi:hypothetical protein